MPEKIYLVDLDRQLVNEWNREFDQHAGIVDARHCDYFDIPADCMVSPANSFGYMDGGLDRVITYELGASIQDNVQDAIIREHSGELPVGSAVIVETNSTKWPFLIAAPTMRVPEDVSHTVNAYVAFRAILLSIAKFNSLNPSKKINSLVCPGLATGIGKMSPKRCAVQMRTAYESCLGPPRILKPREIHEGHFKMKFDEKDRF